ncbi:MAG TPA: nucleotidyltransferase domain-containing protein [Planctomycetota bacterium]|nr:nucleotidyltransferase domain-containing protein [Planctomycetota bacterium]
MTAFSAQDLHRGGSLAAEVAAGAVREVAFPLPPGLDVTGEVVDERRLPVAGADIVLVSPRGGWLGGRVVARTGADGTFAVRAVEPTWSLGALAAGYAPCELVDLEAVERSADAASVHVQLQVLQPGASVVGRVVDENGQGIAGALLVLGRGMGGQMRAGRTRETWCARVLSTDANGMFRCAGPGAAARDHPKSTGRRARRAPSIDRAAGFDYALAVHDRVGRCLRTALADGPKSHFVAVFGSEATGTASADSDIDLAWLPADPELPLADELALQAELTRVAGREVDLVRLDRASTLLRFEVARDGALLAGSPGAFSRFRVEAIAEYLDYEPALRAASERFRRRLAAGGGPLRP